MVETLAKSEWPSFVHNHLIYSSTLGSVTQETLLKSFLWVSYKGDLPYSNTQREVLAVMAFKLLGSNPKVAYFYIMGFQEISLQGDKHPNSRLLFWILYFNAYGSLFWTLGSNT